MKGRNQLVIDIGNSRVKTAIFSKDKIVDQAHFDQFDVALNLIKEWQFESAIISSVKQDENELKRMLGFPFLFLDKNTKMPFTNLYGTPESLGVDRKAAIAGVRAFITDGPVLVIDLGTCITYDLLEKENRFIGGSISPGFQMRFKAMHAQTARLPLVKLDKENLPRLIEDSTETCMQSGVYHGLNFEIQGMIKANKKIYPDLKVILCGGDSKIFESLTKDHIFVIPNLVLYGLNRILSYNVIYH